MGRWLTRDPIGYAGGINLYGYVGGDPVNGSDPSGLAGGYFGISVNGFLGVLGIGADAGIVLDKPCSTGNALPHIGLRLNLNWNFGVGLGASAGPVLGGWVDTESHLRTGVSTSNSAFGALAYEGGGSISASWPDTPVNGVVPTPYLDIVNGMPYEQMEVSFSKKYGFTGAIAPTGKNGTFQIDLSDLAEKAYGWATDLWHRYIN